jgi:hypothetical protein
MENSDQGHASTRVDWVAGYIRRGVLARKSPAAAFAMQEARKILMKPLSAQADRSPISVS